MTEGEESQAYRFRSGTRTYVMRINRNKEGFEKDAFAYERFARPGLPIPEVIEIGQIEEHFFCISENISGVTLQDLQPNELASTLAPTARILDVIAASDLEGISGFGPFDSHGVGSDESWRDFLTSIADFRRYDWVAVQDCAAMNEVHRLFTQLDMLVAHCPETRQLVHGDFGSNNVLSDGQRITGVVDWSAALIGDPLYDVANIFFWRNWLDCMQQQALFFETSLRSSPSLSERVLCYQLRIGLAEIYQNAMSGNTEAGAWATSQCQELIRTKLFLSPSVGSI
ncbi:MAG: aph(4)-Ia [Bryobacterales bacterium]|nr:aph(4)-Ia [Bryobacterales bacterium]